LFIYIEDENGRGFSLQVELIYTQYFGKICKYLTFLIGNRQEAQDIAQEVFLRLLKSPPQEDNVLAWLLTVSKNTAINYLKEKGNRIKREKKYYEMNRISYEDFSEVVHIREILDKMPEEQKNLILLKFSGYTYQEISKILGINLSSVGQMIARAQKKFKKLYEGEEGN